MSFGTKVTLNSGHEIPTLGYGTWQSAPGEVSVGVYEALKAGYRHLDLAKVYENQTDVAKGLKKAFAEIPGLKRQDIFILYLIHWPVAFSKTSDDKLFPLTAEGSNEVVIDRGVSIVDTWKALVNLPKSKVRSIGVSNFAPEHLQAIIDSTEVVPAVNQVERHPLLPQDPLVKYAKGKNIHLTAYSAFGNNTIGEPLLLEHAVIKQIAEKIGATPAQVLLAWAQVGGHSVIPKSVTASRIKSNFEEVKLADEDIAIINKIGETPRRYNIPNTFNPKWDINIWGEELEKNTSNTVI
ncbi:Alcohol dehydrogenase (NADP(+)) [Scedosporium apiospermum]|uniref:Alcohol dehydrogenase (NADP(+)) n=1 Tax=Pseudallescheria apiosperma TaxID=563466 RepID=A0A084FWU6_PSEDA|nr:Alcohol dehydrogenase (NADP(+)) [Scedosporium apiospermum]KEZ39558.1 Alcohol dehydrogenase (NADP(+)) [Scedosporium apiospermum]